MQLSRPRPRPADGGSWVRRVLRRRCGRALGRIRIRRRPARASSRGRWRADPSGVTSPRLRRGTPVATPLSERRGVAMNSCAYVCSRWARLPRAYDTHDDNQPARRAQPAGHTIPQEPKPTTSRTRPKHAPAKSATSATRRRRGPPRKLRPPPPPRDGRAAPGRRRRPQGQAPSQATGEPPRPRRCARRDGNGHTARARARSRGRRTECGG